MALKIRDLFIAIGIEADEAAINRIDKGIDNIKTSANLTATAIKGITIAVGAAAIATGFFLKKAGDLEQTTVAFETMLGSAEAAKKLLGELFDLAATTPFEIEGVLASSKQLLGMGIEADKIIETMTNLGNVSAGLSVPIGRLALNFGQVKAQGKLTGRELRDFAIAGVPLTAVLAENLGIAKEEVAGLVSRGKVGFPEVEQAFRSMATGTGQFADLMQKQAKTLLGLWSNLKDVVTIFSQEVGTELLPAAKSIANEMLNWFEANRKLIKLRAVQFFKEFGKFLLIIFKVSKALFIAFADLVKVFGGLEIVLKNITILFGLFIGGSLVFALGSITQGVWALIKGMKALKIATALANAQALLIPILIGAALVALALVVQDIISFFQGKKSITGLLVEEFENWKIKVLDIVGGTIDEIFRMFRDKWNDFKELPFIKFFRTAGGNIANTFDVLTGGGPASSSASSLASNSSSVQVNSPINVTVPEGTPPELVGSSIQAGIADAMGGILRGAQRDTEPLVEF